MICRSVDLFILIGINDLTGDIDGEGGGTRGAEAILFGCGAAGPAIDPLATGRHCRLASTIAASHIPANIT
jgi:hypothetical protein